MKPMEPLEFKHFDRWWPHALGTPSSVGAQETLQYAYFHNERRLLLRTGGHISTFDTGDHQILGVSQASDPNHIRFKSSRGVVDLSTLKQL